MNIAEIREKIWETRKCRDLYWDSHLCSSTASKKIKNHTLENKDVYAYAYICRKNIADSMALIVLKEKKYTYSLLLVPYSHVNTNYYSGAEFRQMNYIDVIEEIIDGSWDDFYLPEDYGDQGDGFGVTSQAKLIFRFSHIEIFEYKNGEICCQERNVAYIAKKDPLLIYNVIRENYPKEQEVIDKLKSHISIKELKK